MLLLESFLFVAENKKERTALIKNDIDLIHVNYSTQHNKSMLFTDK
jgi:hypothetical protein